MPASKSFESGGLGQQGTEPLVHAVDQHCAEARWPGLAERARQQVDARNQRVDRVAPAQDREAERSHRIEQGGAHEVSGWRGERGFFQDDRAKTAYAACADPAGFRIVLRALGGLDRAGRKRLIFAEVCRQRDAQVGARARHIGNGQPFGAGERVCLIQHRATSAGKDEAARRLSARARDAFGEGAREDGRAGSRSAVRVAACKSCPALCEIAHGLAPWAVVVPEAAQPVVEIA